LSSVEAKHSASQAKSHKLTFSSLTQLAFQSTGRSIYFKTCFKICK